MKKLDLGQTIGIVANLGVIAGIGFLAFELQQNNELMRAEARFAQSERALDIFSRITNSPGLAEAYAKLRTGEELSEVEQVHLQAHVISVYRNFEWQFEEMRLGTIDEELRMQGMRAVMQGNGGMEAPVPWHHYWEVYKRRAAPEFVEWFEENVVND